MTDDPTPPASNPQGWRTPKTIALGTLALVAAGAIGGIVSAHVSDRHGDGPHFRVERAGAFHERGGMMRGGPGGPGFSRDGGDEFESMVPPGMGKGKGKMMFKAGGPAGHGAMAQLMQRAARDHLKITDAELQKALEASVDDMVEDDVISKSEAKELKEHIDEMPDLLGASSE